MIKLDLAKGQSVNLEKHDPGISRANIRLSWDPAMGDSATMDVDVSAILATKDNKYVGSLGEGAICFYNNPKAAGGSVHHLGDERTGASDGDDETIQVDFAAVPSDVDKIVVAATIHDAETKGQNFGQVNNPLVTITNPDTGEDLAQAFPGEEASLEISITIGEFFRSAGSGQWSFRNQITPYNGGFAGLLRDFGFDV